jgi:hypothetical protein
MAYLVRAETRLDGAHAAWLSPPRLGGMRTFASKELAERFDSETSAQAAIDTMRGKEDCRGIHFIVETDG